MTEFNVPLTSNEPKQDKTHKMICAHSKDRQPLLSVWRKFGPRLPIKHTSKIDQTGRMPKLIWVFAGCTGHFVGFVLLWL